MKRSIVLILYFIGYQLLFGALSMAVGHFLPDHKFIIIFVGEILSMIAISTHLILAKDIIPPQPFRLHSSVWALVASLILIAGLGCWTNYLVEILQLPDINEEIIVKMMRHPLGILSIAILAPISEELLFRGAIQPRLIERFNPTIGIIITSLVFGIIHGNPIQIPFAFIMALALGWVSWRTGSLLFSILMHFLNNTSSVILFYSFPEETDPTITDLLGTTGGATFALVGVAVTAICIYLIYKLTARPQAKTTCCDEMNPS